MVVEVEAVFVQVLVVVVDSRSFCEVAVSEEQID